jgi:creatinine amidohydrolase
MYFADENWPELGDYFENESLALVPLGSTEQHGPHLPEETDHLIAEGFAREVTERTG